MSDIVSQETVTATRINGLLRAGRCIARARRETGYTAVATNRDVLRLDGVPLLANKLYAVVTNNLLITITVATDTFTARLSAAVGGATATNASAILTAHNSDGFTGTGGGNGVSLPGLVGFYANGSSDTTLSVVLWHSRLSGTGTIAFNVGAFSNIWMAVLDMGDDPGDTGVEV